MKLFWSALFLGALAAAVLTGALISRCGAKPALSVPAPAAPELSRAAAVAPPAADRVAALAPRRSGGAPRGAVAGGPARAVATAEPTTDAARPAVESSPGAPVDAAEDGAEEAAPAPEADRPAPVEARFIAKRERERARRGASDSGDAAAEAPSSGSVEPTRAASALGGVIAPPVVAPGETAHTGAETPDAPANSAGALASGARVLMVLSASNPSVGQTVSVRVLIERAAGVGSAPFNVGFNPAVLRFDRGTQGSFLGADGRSVVFMIAPSSTGDLVIVGLSRLGENAGVGGSGELCTIYFKVIGAGPANLRFVNGSLRDGHNNTLPGSFDSATLTAH